MSYVLALVGLLLLIWAFAWIGINAPASSVVRWAKWIIITVLVVGLPALLAMGHFRPALFSGFLLLPILFPWRRTRWHPPGAGTSAGGMGRPARGQTMTVNEAAEILGVAPDADTEAIKAAHHELMAKNHPDKGGSPWFASQINQARDTLLAEMAEWSRNTHDR